MKVTGSVFICLVTLVVGWFPRFCSPLLIGILLWLILDLLHVVILIYHISYCTVIFPLLSRGINVLKWSCRKSLPVTHLRMGLETDSCILSDWLFVGRCRWWWLQTTFASSPALLFQFLSSLHHLSLHTLVFRNLYPSVLSQLLVRINYRRVFGCWYRWRFFQSVAFAFGGSYYSHNCTGSPDAPRLQKIPTLGDSRFVYDAWHGLNRIRKWARRENYGRSGAAAAQFCD